MLPAQEIRDTSFRAPNGERVQRLEFTVPATLKEVWDVISTPQGWTSFAFPVLDMELTTGGKFHSNYRAGAKPGDPGTIYNTVLAYLPMQMFAMKIGLTDAFPKEVRDANTLFFVLTMEEAGPRRVKLAGMMVGWQEGPGWDWTWKFFEQGNRQTFLAMYKRFVEGPVDWAAQSRQKGGR
ncbi:MAG: hypothetical protein ACE15B_16505 [Bryobacteraceae bacterium]